MNKKEILREHYFKMGSKGGKQTLRRKGRKHFSEMGRRSAKKRWNYEYPQENDDNA